MDDVPLDAREYIFFQQNAASPYNNVIIVGKHLNQMLPNRWIITNGIVPWPVRSLDFMPLDFFYGYIKNKL